MEKIRFPPDDVQGMLNWLCHSPALLSIGDSACLPNPGHIDLERLAEDLAKTARLGKRFELLVSAVVESSGQYQILARDQAITVNKRTVGAPDLLLKNLSNGQLEHWELTVKFYLGLEKGWLGPGQKDWLENKAAHLAQQQLVLLNRPETQPWLKQYGDKVSSTRLLSRGILFGEGPDYGWLAKGYRHGNWYKPSTLPQRPWRQLSRWQWISNTNDVALPLLAMPIQAPIMLQDPQSQQRHMLVPENWPDNVKGEP
ncbi:DUF1853 family protein [Gallaecimonas mangrovi]|uniref:DUF1853 family protein n=1 Tax=Gallaecimonas mangrovi TaxID=2291597 RepID=UPI000E20231D|nr:DUF1853 family protein [Gallaecimonas mangrovi]